MYRLLEYDQYLSNDFSVDYWADDAIDYAIELAKRLTKQDWADLRMMWQHRPLSWQEKCSQSISRLEVENAFEILEDMLCSPITSVALLAVEGLHGNDRWLPKTSHLPTLERLAKVASQSDSDYIEDLLARGSRP